LSTLASITLRKSEYSTGFDSFAAALRAGSRRGFAAGFFFAAVFCFAAFFGFANFASPPRSTDRTRIA
jgi:hypothetical protein